MRVREAAIGTLRWVGWTINALLATAIIAWAAWWVWGELQDRDSGPCANPEYAEVADPAECVGLEIPYDGYSGP